MVDVGYKYHLSDIQAAIGLVQLGKLESLNKRREEIVQTYNKTFGDVDWKETPVKKPYMEKPAYHNYVIKCDSRDDPNAYLKEKGIAIASSVHYFPNNFYEMYKNCRSDTPVSNTEWKKILTLPLFPDLTKKNVQFIIDNIKNL